MTRTPLAGLLVALLLGIPASIPAQTFDDFNGDVLQSEWSWLREDPSTWQLDDGWLTITTQRGALNGTEFNNVRNVLLQPAPVDAIIRMETRLQFTPTWTYHNAGLIYHIDDDNYIRVSRGIFPNVNGVWMEWEIDGETHFDVVEPVPDEEVYLRLSRTDDSVFLASYSIDGSHWYAIGKETLHFPSGTAKAGLQAANGDGLAAQGPSILARFDYFGMKPTAVSRPQAGVEGFSILQVYPSPLRGGETIAATLRLDAPADLRWYVSDLLGRRITATQSVGMVEAGSPTLTISIPAASPGVYILHVMATHRRAMQRILLTR